MKYNITINLGRFCWPEQVTGKAAFTIFGERFAAHKNNKNLYVVTHVPSGACVTSFGAARCSTAIAEAKEIIMLQCKNSADIWASVEKAREGKTILMNPPRKEMLK